MNIQPTPRNWFNDMVQQNAARVSASASSWLNQTRAQAMDAIGNMTLPDRKQEAWRYTDLGKLYKHSYRYQPTFQSQADDGASVDQWIYADNASYRLVFTNGHYNPNLSDIHSLPDGVRVGSVHQILSTTPDSVSSRMEQRVTDNTDVFNELNRALFNDGLFIHVPENVSVDRPIEVVYLNISHDENLLCQPRSLVILEAGARAKLIERYIGDGQRSYFFNGVTEISLFEHASLEHVRLQQETRLAHHLSRIALRQHTASEYSGVNIATGGAWSRTDINARFEGPHAVCDLNGLYSVGDQQTTDFHLDVLHNVPHCSSRENFKGIVYGNGRAVFDGRILVEKHAQKTDAQLSNKNLLLSENGEVDTKPQLEIHADDVKCSHGTTVGKIDPNQLFYLRSRGIDQHRARQMICLGFAEQVLSHLDDEAVHDYAYGQIADLFDQQEIVL